MRPWPGQPQGPRTSFTFPADRFRAAVARANPGPRTPFTSPADRFRAGWSCTPTTAPVPLAPGIRRALALAPPKDHERPSASQRTGSVRTGSVRTGSVRTGSVRTSSVRTSSARAGSAWARFCAPRHCAGSVSFRDLQGPWPRAIPKDHGRPSIPLWTSTHGPVPRPPVHNPTSAVPVSVSSRDLQSPSTRKTEGSRAPFSSTVDQLRVCQCRAEPVLYADHCAGFDQRPGSAGPWP